MRLPTSDREKELLNNATRSLNDCLAKASAKDFNESLRTLLMGIDALANLHARLTGRVASEREAERDNRNRFIEFLREDIPEWKEYATQWEGKNISLDISELCYVIRCKQLHEYSDLTSSSFPVRLRWNHPYVSDPCMWISDDRNTKTVAYVEINGFHLLQRLVDFAKKYVGIYSSTPTRSGRTGVPPQAIYQLLGTVTYSAWLNNQTS